jgi:hypothetical protein
MHKVTRVSRIDYYLRLFFEDDSVRAIDIASHLKVNMNKALFGAPNLTKIHIHPDAYSIIWDDGIEISADFLYNNSVLIGWVDRSWMLGGVVVKPVKFDTASVKIGISNTGLHTYLLLDEKNYPALAIGSASFGIHENIPWYHVPFPGDEGKYEPEWEEPEIVFETLKRLVKIVNDAVEQKLDVTIDITEHLRQTGCKLFVEAISPRNAAINAEHFKKKSRPTSG